MKVILNTWKLLHARKIFTNMPRNILCLFDVDGTLTESRKRITPAMKDFIVKDIIPKVDVALVGGSDYDKICEQMGGEEDLTIFKYIFSENGLVAHSLGKEIDRKTIQLHMGEEKLQTFINYALEYMSKLRLPVKRGTFIEFRSGLINVCPVGRSCSQKERDEFEKYDKIHKIRENFIQALEKEFPDLGLKYSIGGQISFDAFPEGWDKTYCLNHIRPGSYDEIHFFGDKTQPGGNDHEIYSHSRVIGHTIVLGLEEMIEVVKEIAREVFPLSRIIFSAVAKQPVSTLAPTKPKPAEKLKQEAVVKPPNSDSFLATVVYAIFGSSISFSLMGLIL